MDCPSAETQNGGAAKSGKAGELVSSQMLQAMLQLVWWARR
jgi:hypothetical protein